MNEEQRAINDDLSDIGTKELMAKLPSYFGCFDNNIETNAYLNWRFDPSREIENQFFDMGRAYFETSILLIERCIADNSDDKADKWIFPIMFNIVHGIEIYLKAFNSLYRIQKELVDTGNLKESKIEGKHDIRQLCQTSIKLLRGSKSNIFIDEMLFVQKFIDIIYQNTDDMTFARYPITSKKANHFYVKSNDNVIIDLNVLRQWMLRLSRILDDVSWCTDYQVDELKELHYEIMSDIDC